jgi:hypothetical protein
MPITARIDNCSIRLKALLLKTNKSASSTRDALLESMLFRYSIDSGFVVQSSKDSESVFVAPAACMTKYVTYSCVTTLPTCFYSAAVRRLSGLCTVSGYGIPRLCLLPSPWAHAANLLCRLAVKQSARGLSFRAIL